MTAPAAAAAPAAAGLTLGELAGRLGAEFVGEADYWLERFRPLASAGPRDISFLAQPKLLPQLSSCEAGAVILPVQLRGTLPPSGRALYVADPYLAYARASQWFWQLQHPRPQPGIHERAVVDPAAQIGPGVRIDALAVIEAGAQIGEGCHIGAGCFVGARAVLGRDCVLHPRSVVMHDCVLGARCELQPGAVIGGDGFGYARDETGAGVKIAQVGRVVMGNDVHIGANTTVDRGAMDDTVIADGVKIDNLVQIAHNVHIGAHTAIAGCVGIAGSAKIGANCFLGGGVGVAGHLEIGDGVIVSGMSLVMRSLREPGRYSGAYPIEPQAQWERNAANLRHLRELRDRIRALEQRLQMHNNDSAT